MGAIRSANFCESGPLLRSCRGEMKKIIVLIAGLVVSVLGTEATLAASPVYCALYAKELVKHGAAENQAGLSEENVYDRAYYRCLNLDDEPALPETIAGPDGPGIGGPYVEEASTIAPDRPPMKAKAHGKKWRGSGLAAWSTEWTKWCAEHFPNSFDPKTGTVIPYETGVRTMCR